MSTATITERAKAALSKATKENTLVGLNQKQIEETLLPYAQAIQNALPAGQNPNRLIQMAAFIISGDEKLKECTPRSIIGCVLKTAILGLNPALGECFYIPRNRNVAAKGEKPKYVTEATFQDSYFGLIALARRSGQIKSIYAEVVRAGDEFSYERGTNPYIIHRPSLDTSRPKIAAYAVIQYLNGGTEFSVMSPAQIEQHRMKSPHQNSDGPSGIWQEWEDAMWKKTALREVLKVTPKSTEVAMALQTDNAVLYPESFQDGQVDPRRVFRGDEQGTVLTSSDGVPSSEELQLPPAFAQANTLEELNEVWNSTDDQDKPLVEGYYLARRAQISKQQKVLQNEPYFDSCRHS